MLGVLRSDSPERPGGGGTALLGTTRGPHAKEKAGLPPSGTPSPAQDWECYDVCEFVVQFLNPPGWLASEQ